MEDGLNLKAIRDLYMGSDKNVSGRERTIEPKLNDEDNQQNHSEAVKHW